MNIKQVLKENPEITDELREFFKNKLLKSIEENSKIPDSFKMALIDSGVTAEMVENYLKATPRLICDFMDEKNIIILLDYEVKDGWSYVMNKKPSKLSFKYRFDAE